MGNRSSRPQRGTQPVHIHSFTPRKLLGKGNFAKVFLVERRSDQALFALKLSKKDKISAENKVHHIVEERNILEYLRHTFVTQLRYSFQDDVCLYMILDFVDGGDLRSHMKSHMWTEAEARVVIAEIACGLTYLHQNQIVHRDIKPENILMSRSGHITISDFNVAIRLAPGVPIRSMAGTEPYMAPEILNRVGYFSAVDWWSLGVLLFELVFAERPFRTKNRRELIKKGVFSFPYHMPAISEICQSAISGFLAFDPAHRIGFGEIGQPLLRGHPYFLGLSWAAVERREQAPIYVPALTPQTLHPQMAVDNDVLDEDLERLLRDTASLSSGSDPSPQQANIVEQFFYYDYMIHANRALEAQEHVVAEITASSRMVRSQTSSNDSEPPDHINSFHGTTNISFCGPSSRRPSHSSIAGRRASLGVPSGAHTPITAADSHDLVVNNSSSATSRHTQTDSVNGLSKLFKGLARRRSKNQSDFFAVDSSCITGQGSTSGSRCAVDSLSSVPGATPTAANASVAAAAAAMHGPADARQYSLQSLLSNQPAYGSHLVHGHGQIPQSPSQQAQQHQQPHHGNHGGPSVGTHAIPPLTQLLAQSVGLPHLAPLSIGQPSTGAGAGLGSPGGESPTKAGMGLTMRRRHSIAAPAFRIRIPDSAGASTPESHGSPRGGYLAVGPAGSPRDEMVPAAMLAATRPRARYESTPCTPPVGDRAGSLSPPLSAAASWQTRRSSAKGARRPSFGARGLHAFGRSTLE